MQRLAVILAILGVLLAGCESAPPDVKVSGQGAPPEVAKKAKTQNGKAGPNELPD